VEISSIIGNRSEDGGYYAKSLLENKWSNTKFDRKKFHQNQRWNSISSTTKIYLEMLVSLENHVPERSPKDIKRQLSLMELISFGQSFRVGIEKDNPGKLITTGIFCF